MKVNKFYFLLGFLVIGIILFFVKNSFSFTGGVIFGPEAPFEKSLNLEENNISLIDFRFPNNSIYLIKISGEKDFDLNLSGVEEVNYPFQEIFVYDLFKVESFGESVENRIYFKIPLS
ncbi:hypothetical protein HOD88_02450 [archaeon]|jgi:hypothetical protein|nr:hypothetical protein [archaeon]MBT6995027.1 hypothetical protein [Candidatus Woesearchaeota archaeon]